MAYSFARHARERERLHRARALLVRARADGKLAADGRLGLQLRKLRARAGAFLYDDPVLGVGHIGAAPPLNRMTPLNRVPAKRGRHWAARRVLTNSPYSALMAVLKSCGATPTMMLTSLAPWLMT